MKLTLEVEDDYAIAMLPDGTRLVDIGRWVEDIRLDHDFDWGMVMIKGVPCRCHDLRRRVEELEGLKFSDANPTVTWTTERT